MKTTPKQLKRSKQMGKPNEVITPQAKTQDELMKALGVDVSQVEENTKTATTREINTKSDALKEATKQAVDKANRDNGTNMSFVCIKRDGTLKDANGKAVLDDNGKKKPRFVKQSMKGYWTMDKTSEGFISVSRTHYYTETHLIADFTAL
jgi:hypothetical protein